MTLPVVAPVALLVPTDLKEVVLGSTLETNEIVRRMPQRENLSPGELLQVGENRSGGFPMVAYPGQRIENQTKMLPAEVRKQLVRMPTGATGVSFQFRPVAGDIGGVGRLKGSP